MAVHEVAGVATEFDHDALGRVTGACTGAALATCDSSGGQEQAWTHDDADRVTAASLRWSASGRRATTLGREDIGRVISATHPDSSSETWGSDLAGNLARHLDEAGVERTWSHDGWGRLSSESVPGLATSIAHAYARARHGDHARVRRPRPLPGGGGRPGGLGREPARMRHYVATVTVATSRLHTAPAYSSSRT